MGQVSQPQYWQLVCMIGSRMVTDRMYADLSFYGMDIRVGDLCYRMLGLTGMANHLPHWHQSYTNNDHRQHKARQHLYDRSQDGAPSSVCELEYSGENHARGPDTTCRMGS